MLGRFYSANYHTFISTITPSQVTPQKDNWSKFATSQETYPVDFLPRHEEYPYPVFNQFIFQFWIVCNPSGPDMKYTAFFLFLLKWADSQFGFSNLWSISQNGQNGLIPNSEFWTLLDLVQMVKMGWFPIRISDTFKFSPNLWIISPNGLSNEIARKR